MSVFCQRPENDESRQYTRFIKEKRPMAYIERNISLKTIVDYLFCNNYLNYLVTQIMLALQ